MVEESKNDAGEAISWPQLEYVTLPWVWYSFVTIQWNEKPVKAYVEYEDGHKEYLDVVERVSVSMVEERDKDRVVKYQDRSWRIFEVEKNKNISIANDGEWNIEIAEASSGRRCIVKGIEYITPYNATCYPGDDKRIWRCDAWYKSMREVDGAYACVSTWFEIGSAEKGKLDEITKRISRLSDEEKRMAYTIFATTRMEHNNSRNRSTYAKDISNYYLNHILQSLFSQIDWSKGSYEYIPDHWEEAKVEVIEKTVYLDLNKWYQISFDSQYDYVIQDHSNLLVFNDVQQHLYALESWWLIKSNTIATASLDISVWGIPISGEMIAKWAKIFVSEVKERSNGETRIYVVAKNTRDVLADISISFIEWASPMPVSQSLKGIELQQNNISIEEFLSYSLMWAEDEVKNKWDSATYAWFLSAFGDNWSLNLKLSLARYWYIRSSWKPVSVYWETIWSADLWNLFLWYLWESVGIFEDGWWFSDKIEQWNYKKYYWNDLAWKRGQIDEIVDKPRYEAWKNIFLKSRNPSLINKDTYLLSLLISQEAKELNPRMVCSDEKETYENYKLCKESSGTVLWDIEFFPELCSRLYVQRWDDIAGYRRVLDGERITIHDIYPIWTESYEIFKASVNKYKSKEDYNLCFN